MSRWLPALGVAILTVGAGYLAFLNPEPAVVHLTPGRTVSAPLAVVLVAALALGAMVVTVVVFVRAGARAWRGAGARRRARREARRAAATARAQDLVWTGDYAQARAELLRGGGDVQADVTRATLVAETHLQEGDAAAARRLLDAALARVGLEPHLLALLADAAERLGDLRGAADALERARTARPDSPRLSRRLRDVYMASGRWAEALALQGHILLGIRAPAALAAEERILRGLRYQNALAEADPKRAIRLLKVIAREDRTFLPAAVSAGDLLLGAGRRLAARRLWERAARARPAAVLLERVEQLNREERKAERTTRFYRRLLHLHPAAPAVSLLLGRHLIANDKLGEAAELLSGLPPSLADLPFAHVLWGELNRRRGNFEVAAESLVRARGAGLGLTAPFRCTACRHASEAWQGYCAACRAWGTLEADADRATAGA